MKLIVTPTLKAANNDKTRTHLYELLAQRVTGYVEPHYISDDMLRGMDDEIIARDEYTKHHAPVEQTGFITNDKWGFRSEEHTSDLQSLMHTSNAVFCMKK